MAVHLGRPLGCPAGEEVSHQSPAHQVGEKVAEGSSCGRAEAYRAESQGEREEETRDDGQEYGAGDGKGLQEDVDADETSKHLRTVQHEGGRKNTRKMLTCRKY